MFTSSKEYLNLCFENQNKLEREAKLNESAITEAVKIRNDEVQSIYEQQSLNNTKRGKSAKIRQEVKKALLFECVYTVYKKSLGLINSGNHVNESMCKSFVNEFIDENGVEVLLSSFKSKTFMLSEFARLVNKYTNIVCEKSNVENPDNFSISPEEKDNFYDELNIDDIDDASQMIKTRVSAAVDDFLSDNLNSKEEIKDIIAQSQTKISDTSNSELKESYQIQAKRKITSIRERKTKSIFESMVFNLAKTSILNEDMKKIYLKNDKLDMDKIVETANLIYTFVETLSTCNMINVDEAYLASVLDSLK